MISLQGHVIHAVFVDSQPTKAFDAWLLGQYRTVRLERALPALRVHARGGIGAAANPTLVGAGTSGRWFAIGDVILQRAEYVASHALPATFTAQAEWLLPIGTILNVGVAGPLFRHPGGGLQAEWLSGLPPQEHSISGFWLNRSGTA